ncbi:hypothetical protein AC249_AIPGENE3271 [Exaiptasia diaphana]|nr:hypothetical protein AC249_AIPGENE3271 [Exaiptasia diaphana]
MAARESVEEQPCKASRKCDKEAGHKGRCNTQKQVNKFWETSIVYKLNVRKRKLLDEEERFEEEQEAKLSHLKAYEDQVTNAESEFQNQLIAKEKELSCLQVKLEESEGKVKQLQEELSMTTQSLEQLKSIVSALVREKMCTLKTE